jgi:hypothetical protein
MTGGRSVPLPIVDESPRTLKTKVPRFSNIASNVPQRWSYSEVSRGDRGLALDPPYSAPLP